MFRAYLGPSSGGTTVWIQQLVLIIIFRWLSVVQPGQQTVVIYLRLYLLMMGLDTLETCRGWRNILSYNLCIKLVFLYTIISRCTVKKHEILKILSAFAQSRKVSISFIISVRYSSAIRSSVCLSAHISAAPLGRISVKFYNADFYKSLSIKPKFC